MNKPGLYRSGLLVNKPGLYLPSPISRLVIRLLQGYGPRYAMSTAATNTSYGQDAKPIHNHRICCTRSHSGIEPSELLQMLFSQLPFPRSRLQRNSVFSAILFMALFISLLLKCCACDAYTNCSNMLPFYVLTHVLLQFVSLANDGACATRLIRQ